MKRKKYPSDISDEERAFVASYADERRCAAARVRVARSL
jgi:hypothetical protein